jgi:hypothetical protein
VALQAEPWIKGDASSVKGGRLDLAQREVRSMKWPARGGGLLIRRAADGSIDFVQPPALRVVAASQKDTAAPWKLTVGEVSRRGLALRFEDARRVAGGDAHDRGDELDAENLSTEPGQIAKAVDPFQAQWPGRDRGGRQHPGLPARRRPQGGGQERWDCCRCSLTLPSSLNIDVTRGQVTLDGAVQLRQERAQRRQIARHPLSGGFTGQVTVGDFYAVDKINSADFLKWKSLYLARLDLR